MKNCYCIQLSPWRIERYLPQFAVSIRFVSPDFVVKEELLDLVALQESTRGVDIKNALDSIMKTFDMPLNKLVSIATVGTPAMLGKKILSYWAFKRSLSNSTIHTDLLHNSPRNYKITKYWKNPDVMISVTHCKLHSHQCKKSSKIQKLPWRNKGRRTFKWHYFTSLQRIKSICWFFFDSITAFLN